MSLWCMTSCCDYGHCVHNTFISLTEGRSARDLPKQQPAKKKLVVWLLHGHMEWEGCLNLLPWTQIGAWLYLAWLYQRTRGWTSRLLVVTRRKEYRKYRCWNDSLFCLHVWVSTHHALLWKGFYTWTPHNGLTWRGWVFVNEHIFMEEMDWEVSPFHLGLGAFLCVLFFFCMLCFSFWYRGFFAIIASLSFTV